MMEIIDKLQDMATNIDNYGLTEVIRYDGKQKIKEENVAEHSALVGLIIIEVCNILNIDEDLRNKAVVYGLLHDVVEQYMGDASYEFKSHPKFKKNYQEMESLFNKLIYDEYYKDKYGRIMFEVMTQEDKICDRLLKLADSIAVVQYATREITFGNTTETMQFIYTNGLERVKYDYERLVKVL